MGVTEGVEHLRIRIDEETAHRVVRTRPGTGHEIRRLVVFLGVVENLRPEDRILLVADTFVPGGEFLLEDFRRHPVGLAEVVEIVVGLHRPVLERRVEAPGRRMLSRVLFGRNAKGRILERQNGVGTHLAVRGFVDEALPRRRVEIETEARTVLRKVKATPKPSSSGVTMGRH